MAVFTFTPGQDTFTGLEEPNFYDFTTADLQATDTITGSTSILWFDFMRLTAPGSVTAGQFTGATHIDWLVLPNGTNHVELADGFVSKSSFGYFIVTGGEGNDTVDGSGVTTVPLMFYPNGGDDTFSGGSSVNYYQFPSNGMTSADTIVGGPGFDRVYVGGVVTADAFQNVSNIEQIDISSGDRNHDFALSGAVGGGSILGYLGIVIIPGENDLVDLSGVTSGTVVVYSPGVFGTFLGGGAGAATYFDFDHLDPRCTVTGGAGFDVVQLEIPAARPADAFANVTGIEAVFFAAGGNSLILTDGTVAGSMLGHFVARGGAGDDSLDAIGVTAQVMHFYAGDGSDTFLGGGVVDVFLTSADALDAADVFAGNGGTNYLQIDSNGAVSSASLAGISDITFLGLSVGGSVTLADNLSTTRLYVTGSGASDAFDGAGVNSYEIAFYGFGGADTLTGGAQNDLFHFQDTAFTAIDGNAGIDYLLPIQDSLTLDISANAAKIDDIEAIWLDQANGVAVSLVASDITDITSTDALYVVGGADDTLDAGSGWSFIGAHTNGAVAPNVTFLHYQHTDGQTLYVDDEIDLTIAAGSPALAALGDYLFV